MIRKRNKKSSIEVINEPNKDGFVIIEMSVGDHGAAVTVIGEGYDEAITRAIIIRDAFRAIETKIGFDS
jgi:hypothetical protein